MGAGPGFRPDFGRAEGTSHLDDNWWHQPAPGANIVYCIYFATNDPNYPYAYSLRSYPTKEEADAWRAKIAPVLDDWAKSVKGGEQVLRAYRAEIDKATNELR